MHIHEKTTTDDLAKGAENGHTMQGEHVMLWAPENTSAYRH